MDRRQHHPARQQTSELSREIQRARDQLHRARHQQAVRNDLGGTVTTARFELVEALQAYLSRLAEEGTPVPYRLRDELRLLTSLIDSDRR